MYCFVGSPPRISVPWYLKQVCSASSVCAESAWIFWAKADMGLVSLCSLGLLFPLLIAWCTGCFGPWASDSAAAQRLVLRDIKTVGCRVAGGGNNFGAEGRCRGSAFIRESPAGYGSVIRGKKGRTAGGSCLQFGDGTVTTLAEEGFESCLLLADGGELLLGGGFIAGATRSNKTGDRDGCDDCEYDNDNHQLDHREAGSGSMLWSISLCCCW